MTPTTPMRHTCGYSVNVPPMGGPSHPLQVCPNCGGPLTAATMYTDAAYFASRRAVLDGRVMVPNEGAMGALRSHIDPQRATGIPSIEFRGHHYALEPIDMSQPDAVMSGDGVADAPLWRIGGAA